VQVAVARSPAAREAAFRLRFETVVAEGWAQPSEYPSGLEQDADDERAIILIGEEQGAVVATARLILPSEIPLPTERTCGITVEPRGAVADVGRIVVAPSHRHRRHRLLVPLLAGTYLELRRQGLSVACGMMTPVLRSLLRLLGFELQVLGADRAYWHAQRAPVRFEAAGTAPALLSRWSATGEGS